jgi:hypothetical protein
MIEDFARVLREQIRNDMNNYADDLAGGQCRSFDEYQKLCGVIQGLAVAERYLLDLAEKAKNQNE